MQRLRRKRCCICKELFRADPRVGAGQVTCGAVACQAARRREMQSAWRGRHLDYDVDRRMRLRLAQEEKAMADLTTGGWCDPAIRPRVPSLPRSPPLGRRLPWDLIHSVLGTLQTDVLAQLLREVSYRFEARSRPP